MARPSEYPRWEAAPADIINPPEAKKDVGWNVAGEKPPRQWFNWLWNLIYLWLVYLDTDKVAVFNSPVAVVAAPEVAVGDVVAIKPHGLEPWAAAWEASHLASATYTGGVTHMVCTGALVAVAVQSITGAPAVQNVHVHNAETGAEEPYSPLVIGAAISGLATDGGRLFVAHSGQDVTSYDLADGSVLGTFTMAGAAFLTGGMVADGVNLYVARYDGGFVAAGVVQAYDAAAMSGAVVWTYTDPELGQQWNGLAYSRGRLYAIKDGGTNRLKAINASDGTLYSHRDLPTGTSNKAVATDGDNVFVATDVDTQLVVGYLQDSSYGDTVQVLQNAQAATLAVGPRYLVRGMADFAANQTVFKASLKAALVASDAEQWDSNAANVARACATDGRFAFYGGLIRTGPAPATDATLRAMALPVGATLARRVANTDTTRKFTHLLLQPED